MKQNLITFYTFSVDLSFQGQQVFYNVYMSFVAGNHEAGMSMSVCNLNVSIVIHQKFNDTVVPIKTSCSEWRGVGVRGLVNICTICNQIGDNL